MGFFDGLLEMYKLLVDIARAELMSDSAVSTYNHKFGTFILETTSITNLLGLNLLLKWDFELKLLGLNRKDWIKEWKRHSLLTIF